MREKLPSDLEKKQSNVVEIEEWYSDQLYKRRTFPHTNDRVMLDPLRNSGSHYISSEYFIQICIFWSENFTAEREKQWGIFQKKGTLKEKIHDSVCLPELTFFPCHWVLHLAFVDYKRYLFGKHVVSIDLEPLCQHRNRDHAFLRCQFAESNYERLFCSCVPCTIKKSKQLF